MGIIAMKCPQCGADVQLDETRDFGFCTFCGTKVMQEKIIVEHSGSVKVDTSEELKKLYIAARNSAEAGDTTAALDYYRKITTRDPNSWEALFYSVIFGLNGIKNGEIKSAAIRISNCLPKVFELILKYVDDISAQKDAVNRIAEECYNNVVWLLGASHSFHKDLSSGNGTIAAIGAHSVVDGLANGFGSVVLSGAGTLLNSVANSANRSKEDSDRCLYIVNILDECGNLIKSNFDISDNEYKELMLNCWKAYLSLAIEHANINDVMQNEISIRINKYDSSFGIIEKKAMTKLIEEATDEIGADASFGKAYTGALKFLWNKIPKKVKKFALIALIIYVVFMIILFANI